MRARKPKPDLEIYFSGSEMFPERVPVRSLADVLSGIHRLAAPDNDDDEKDSASIRLLDVRRGSAVFRCVVDEADALIPRLRQAAVSLLDPESSEAIGPALPALRGLSTIASALNSPIVIRNPDDREDVIAIIEPDTYKKLSEALLVKGDKSITGTVERIGGAKETRCLLRVPGRRRLLYCNVGSADIARELGIFLYQKVTVVGTAQWLRSTWDLVSFNIREIVQPDSGSLAEAFEGLRIAGGDGWDKVKDPEHYLTEHSGDR